MVCVTAQQKGKTITLIYIMGDGRSGSTILDIILGNHPDIEGVGELFKWSRHRGGPKPGDDKQENHRFWTAISKQYFAKNPTHSFKKLREIQKPVEAYRKFFRVITGLLPTEVLEKYSAHVYDLLTSIVKVSRKSTIVDSSKRMGRAYLLEGHPKIQVKIIHLVRDPRAVMWSQMKENVEQKTKHPIKAMLHYWIKNLFCTIVQIKAHRGKVLRVRYEDLVINPIRELQRIGDFLGINMTPLIEKIENDRQLKVNHIIDGNRIRKKEYVKLRYDDAWKKNLSFFQKVLAILLTFPFCLVYRYVP